MPEAADVEKEAGSSDLPLVSVTFQKNAHRKLKYLEGEPKVLGITQIGLSVFQASCMTSFIANSVYRSEIATPFVISTILIFIGGCVALASKNLHPPTLKACVGMEIVAALASVFNLLLTLGAIDEFYCYSFEFDNITANAAGTCQKVEAARLHVFTDLVVMQVTLLSISVTLMVYACKVVNCCSPATKVPVISIEASPAPH
ncbi:unnamed protein product [Knipowitschia caucasica]|uniref:Uncharacterized protein n=1 Tax=Knipowitschia caucasica TaxID=637954 RepID=A0AAV2KRB8_KNICA